MTACIFFLCETAPPIELGTHQEMAILSRTCLLSSEFVMNLNSYKLTSERLNELAVKDTILSEHVLSSITALTWYSPLHVISKLKDKFIKGKPEFFCKRQFLQVRMCLLGSQCQC